MLVSRPNNNTMILTTCVRTLAQFSCTKSRKSRERLSLAGSTDGGVNVSSSRLATLRRFGADGPGCGGPPHRTVRLWWSRLSFRPNELLHTAHTKGFGLQRLKCLTKCPRLANARPHVEHICIVKIDVLSVLCR